VTPVWAQLATHVTFLVFVAGAVYAQALTGFALALILLGLVGATNVVPLTDAVNATTIIGFCTAWLFLYRNRALRIEKVLVPTVIASAGGVVVGALLLVWLAGAAYQLLRLVLGASIVACALSLWRAAQPLPAMSSARTFAITGGIAGIMGGMFSAGDRRWSICCIGSRSLSRGSGNRSWCSSDSARRCVCSSWCRPVSFRFSRCSWRQKPCPLSFS